MAKSHITQTVCVLYLILSGHILVECRRVRQEKPVSIKQDSSDAVSALEKQSFIDQIEENSIEEMSTLKTMVETEDASDSGHPWCNPFSKQRTRSYYFEVEESQNHCEDGLCTAIELVRDNQNPLMKIHQGQAWSVQKSASKGLEWKLFTPASATKEKEMVIPLLDVEAVTLTDGDETTPEKLDIFLATCGMSTDNCKALHEKDVFAIEGGLYMDANILRLGLWKMDRLSGGNFSRLLENATKPTLRTTGSHLGSWVGGSSGALVIGGFYTAATLTGVAVQSQALAGAAILGILGGTVGGALLGGFIGLGVGLGLALAGYEKVRGYETISASRKIFQKLRCLSEFKECSDNTIVPSHRSCPSDESSD